MAFSGWTMETRRLKHFLLIGQSVVFLIAFASIYRQAPGLFGETGIAPIAAKIERCADPERCEASAVYWLVKKIGVRPSTSFQLLCMIGCAIAISTMVFEIMRNFLSYIFMTWLYLALFNVGDVFLWFQWDTLLLESGYLMALLAGFKNSPMDVIPIFLIRWLATRLMFASGIVKLQSMCPTWWGLTALDIHFESQCLPTPLSWFAHNQPEWIRHLGVAGTFFIEIFLPPLFLLPLPTLRFLAAVPQIALMIMIMLTGNYNFFNIHYALLVFACFEGYYTRAVGRSKMSKVIEAAISYTVFGVVAYLWAAMFGIGYDSVTGTITSQIRFSKEQFAEFVRIGMSITVHLGVVAYALATITALALAWQYSRMHSVSSPKSKKGGEKPAKLVPPPGGIVYGKIPLASHFLLAFGLGSFFFWISFVPFTNIDSAATARIPSTLRYYYEATSPFEIAHSYGLFRRMTGTEGRPEIVLEGSDEPNGPWTEIPFYAKPGNVGEMPKFVAPHQPRLDWQMWFGALGAYQNNAWFLSTVNRLLHNDTSVIALLENWPFKDKKKPLRFLRAQLYHYHFTKPGTKAWWTRHLQHEYMPVMTKDSPAILEYLQKNSLVTSKKYPATDIDKYVVKLAREAAKIPQATFVWSVLASAAAIIFVRRPLQSY